MLQWIHFGLAMEEQLPMLLRVDLIMSGRV